MPEEPTKPDEQPEPLVFTQHTPPTFTPTNYDSDSSVQPDAEVSDEPMVIEPVDDDLMVISQDVEPSTEPTTRPTAQPVPVFTPESTSFPISSIPDISSELSEPSSVTVSQPFIKPKRKKGLLIGLIVTIAVVILGGGSALAYQFWYQNPNKVVTDALIGAVTSKSVSYVGSLNTDSGTAKFKVEVTGQQLGETGNMDAKMTLTSGSKDYVLNGSVIIDEPGDLYFKVENLTNLSPVYEALTDSSSVVDKLVAKIDGTWIKISSKELSGVSSSAAKSKTCINDAVDKFKGDKAALSEISSLYQKHSFIIVDKQLGTKDGNLGYSVKTDSAAAKAFAIGLEDTAIYKQLNGCDNTFIINPDKFFDQKSTSTSGGTTEMWISTLGHELKKLTISEKTDQNSTVEISIATTFNQAKSAKAPTSSIGLSQLTTDLQALTSGGTLSTDATDVKLQADVSSVGAYAQAYASNNKGAYPTLLQLKAYLPISVQAKVGAVTKGASDPSTIGYVICGTKGGDVSYYDTATKTIKHKTVGTCS